MSLHKIRSVFSGMRVWGKTINNEGITLIVPDYNDELEAALIPALYSFLALDEKEKSAIKVVYNDMRTFERLCDSTLNFTFQKINEHEMNCLVSYTLFSAKHYGVPRDPNVKLVSFENLYCNQLKLIADNHLFPTEYLITEMILNRV